MCTLSEYGAAVCVITGRDALTVVRLGGLERVPGLVVSALYGLETWQDGHLATVDQPPVLARVRRVLPDVVARTTDDPDVWIEDKRLSLVVHTRRSADPAGARSTLRGPVAALATELGLEAHDGRDVVEIRLPGFDKGGALRGLVTRFEPQAVLFAGDDVGDLPAFAVVREMRAGGRTAFGVAVRSPEAPEVAEAADVHLDDPGALVALLTDLGSGQGVELGTEPFPGR
jgi:trehalose 6-phosphate phosphatase